MSEQKKTKNANLCIRFNEEDLKRLKSACHRDELKISKFIEGVVVEGLEKLVEQQKIRGYQCMLPS